MLLKTSPRICLKLYSGVPLLETNTCPLVCDSNNEMRQCNEKLLRTDDALELNTSRELEEPIFSTIFWSNDCFTSSNQERRLKLNFN